MEGGHRAIIFNRLSGVKEEVTSEGMHLMIPWFDIPVIYDVRPKPRMIQSLTGSKGEYLIPRYVGAYLVFCVYDPIRSTGVVPPESIGYGPLTHSCFYSPSTPTCDRHADGQHHYPCALQAGPHAAAMDLPDTRQG